MNELTVLKCRLYLSLLNKEIDELTNAEVSLMAALASDKDVQEKISKQGEIKLCRVWYVRNLPGDPQYFCVASVEDAKAKIRKLTEQDVGDDSVRTNAMGFEVYEDGDWTEYHDHLGRDIMELV